MQSLKYSFFFFILYCIFVESCGFEFAGFTFPFQKNKNDVVQSGNQKIEAFENMDFNYTLSCNFVEDLISRQQNSSLTNIDSFTFGLTTQHPSIAKLDKQKKEGNFDYTCKKDEVYSLHVQSGHLGITFINVDLNSDGEKLIIKDFPMIEVRIKRKISLFEELGVIILAPLILINKCAFGAKIDLSVLKHIIMQPVGLILCFFMQFVFMPTLSIFFSTILSLSPTMSLALFVVASCPGGGGGYVFSYLINGDVTLAICASLLSTLLAIGVMPAILGTYEHFAHVPTDIAIPYFKIVFILLAIAIPISTGMIIKHKYSKFAEKFIMIIQPLSLFLIVCGIIYLAVSSRYIIYGPTIGWFLCPVLPLTIFITAVGLSRLFGLDWSFAKAVSLESGMKNTVLGIAVIELSFPQPEADLASVMILMITIGHTFLPLLWYFVFLLKKKFCIVKSNEFSKISTVDPDSDGDCEESTLFITTTIRN